ncbi:MAG TPA: hypothetical protein PLA71_01410 [Saccharofermentans sp.]|nr:hypothetical protein [Saccharofermentans sp.]
MNKLIFFVLGAAVGAGTTYFVMKRKTKKLEQTITERDNEDADAMRKRLERAVVGEEVEETSEDELLDYYMDKLRELGVDFSYVEEESSDDVEEVNPSDEDIPDDDGCAVYPIQKILYDAGKSDYSKEHLAYYAGDKVFVDVESGEPIDNWKQYLGTDFDFEGTEFKSSDTVYIRNEALESDYEVTIYTGSFAGATGESDDEDDYNPGDMAD